MCSDSKFDQLEEIIARLERKLDLCLLLFSEDDDDLIDWLCEEGECDETENL